MLRMGPHDSTKRAPHVVYRTCYHFATLLKGLQGTGTAPTCNYIYLTRTQHVHHTRTPPTMVFYNVTALLSDWYTPTVYFPYLQPCTCTPHAGAG